MPNENDSRQSKVNYVDKKEMLQEIKEYKKTGIISEKLGLMFLKIAERYSTIYKFYAYTYKKDMIGDAVLRMVMKIDKFDPDRQDANPFAYFTFLTHRQFLGTLNNEKKQRLAKERLRVKVWEDAGFNVEDLEQQIDFEKEINESKKKRKE